MANDKINSGDVMSSVVPLLSMGQMFSDFVAGRYGKQQGGAVRSPTEVKDTRRKVDPWQLAYLLGSLGASMMPQNTWQARLGAFGASVAQQALLNQYLQQLLSGGNMQNPL